MDEIRLCNIEGYEKTKETYYFVRYGNKIVYENRKYKKPKILNTYIKKGESNKYPCIKPVTTIKNNNGKGYKAKEIRIHRIIGIAFIDNPYNLPLVGHWDENKNNYNLNNLYWTNYSRNTKYSIGRKKQVEGQRSLFDNNLLKLQEIPNINQSINTITGNEYKNNIPKQTSLAEIDQMSVFDLLR
jgi:hypothetical protein